MSIEEVAGMLVGQAGEDHWTARDWEQYLRAGIVAQHHKLGAPQTAGRALKPIMTAAGITEISWIITGDPPPDWMCTDG